MLRGLEEDERLPVTATKEFWWPAHWRFIYAGQSYPPRISAGQHVHMQGTLPHDFNYLASLVLKMETTAGAGARNLTLTARARGCEEAWNTHTQVYVGNFAFLNLITHCFDLMTLLGTIIPLLTADDVFEIRVTSNAALFITVLGLSGRYR